MCMSFEFETQENFGGNRFPNTSSSGSKMVDFLIKKGFVKDAASANIILILCALIAVSASIYFFVFGFNLPQGSAPTPTQRIPAQGKLEL